MKKILILNGPNLNLLGKREPHIYGTTSFETYLEKLCKEFPSLLLDYFQSNVEGELINKIQICGFDKTYRAILLNAGGYTHTSVAIADTIKAIEVPVIEIHISNVAAREEFRHTSLLQGVCKGSISGFGLDSYRLGILASENLG